jgi:hypothetical protein
MHLDHDLFPAIAPINAIELEGKKFLVKLSQAESAKGKEVVIVEEHSSKV